MRARNPGRLRSARGFGLEQGLGIGDMMCRAGGGVEDLTHVLGQPLHPRRGQETLSEPHRSVQHKAADHSASKPPAYRLFLSVVLAHLLHPFCAAQRADHNVTR